MVKKLDEETKLVIESFPENLRKLAIGATEIGYLSQSELDLAIEADEIPDDEQDGYTAFFLQDLGLEILETDNFAQNMDKYYDDDSDEPRDKTRNLLNADAEQVDVNDDDYEHFA